MKVLTVTLNWCGAIIFSILTKKLFVMKMKSIGHYEEEPAVHQNWRSTHVANTGLRTKNISSSSRSRGLSQGSDEDIGLSSDFGIFGRGICLEQK